MKRMIFGAMLFVTPTSLMANAPTAAPAATTANEALLFDAARAGRVDLIDAFVAKGANLNARDARGFTPIIIAAYNGQSAMVDGLIAAGADACLADMAQGNTALMGAAVRGYDAIAQRLIAAGCDVNTRNMQGQTALMMAAMFDRATQAKMLLDAGADPTFADQAGRTAEAIARQQNNKEVLGALTKR